VRVGRMVFLKEVTLLIGYQVDKKVVVISENVGCMCTSSPDKGDVWAASTHISHHRQSGGGDNARQEVMGQLFEVNQINISL